jgi:hypothetical protein
VIELARRNQQRLADASLRARGAVAGSPKRLQLPDPSVKILEVAARKVHIRLRVAGLLTLLRLQRTEEERLRLVQFVLCPHLQEAEERNEERQQAPSLILPIC